MNCQKARDTFPELLDRRTPVTAHVEARAHLAACPDCQRDYSALTQTLTALDAMPTPQPSARLRQNFYAMLEEEKHSAESVRAATIREHRVRRASLWRWILAPALACAIALLAFQAGLRYGTTPAASTDDGTKHQLAALQKQVQQMTQLVGYSLLQQQASPANDRLREVLAAAKTEQPSEKVLETLLGAVSADPSANIRLSALEALFPHADNKNVRAGIIAALPREQNPLVQLEMIDFVAATHDHEAVPALERLSQHELIDQTVREAARKALVQL
jgi:anti-sigma-K factor RskA